MSADEIEARVLTLLRHHAKNDLEPRSDTDIVADAEMDSVAVMDFVMELEDEFDVTIPLDRLNDARTVRDVAQELSGIVAESAH